MPKIDDIFPDVGVIPAMVIVIVIGIALQMSGAWITMLIAGFFGALFTRKHRLAFIAGFIGVALAWTILFVLLIYTAQALAIAEFFVGLLGISGGIIVLVISILLGAFLGGFGGIFGRSVIELIDEFLSSEKVDTTMPSVESGDTEVSE